MQRYAGIASVKLSSVNLISVTAPNIRNPTIINAGAVANDGIVINNGERTTETRNNKPVTAAVKPVRPPSATPAEDSTNVVVVDVPKIAPADVAIASDIRAGLMLGSFPFSSSIPAFVLTPIIVPNVSNKSTKRNSNTTIIKLTIPTALKSSLKHCPKVSPKAEKSKLTKCVGITEKKLSLSGT